MNEWGFPAHEARHFDNDGWYEAETITDHAAAAYEQHVKDNPKPGPGERVVVRYTRPKSKPLPPFDGGKHALREPDSGENKAEQD